MIANATRPDLAGDLRYIAAHENDPRKEEILYEAADALDAAIAAEQIAASADTHPKDGDVQQASLVSGAVPHEDAGDAQPSSGTNQ